MTSPTKNITVNPIFLNRSEFLKMYASIITGLKNYYELLMYY